MNLELAHLEHLAHFQEHSKKLNFVAAFGADAERLWAELEANGRNLLALDLTHHNIHHLVDYLNHQKPTPDTIKAMLIACAG